MEKDIPIEPVEYKVLIKPDEFREQTDGGIYFPDDVRDRHQLAQDRGTLVKMGGLAFSDWKGEKPKAGDKVIYNKYAGTLISLRGKEVHAGDFRLCNDKDIAAIWRE